MRVAAHGWIVGLLISLLGPAPAGAGEPGAVPRGLDLPPALREALRAEMRAVDTRMQEAIAALPRGQWERLAQAARKIEGAFILEQQLTDAQKAELRRRLPQGFVRLDRRFHETAGQLARAADQRDGEFAVFYTYQMLDSCVRCHSRYAPGRFPALGPPPEGVAAD